MLKIEECGYFHEHSLNACIAGVTGDNELRSKLEHAKSELERVETEYRESFWTEVTDRFPDWETACGEGWVTTAGLSQRDLVSLYDKYFRKKGKPARAIYDELLNCAEDQCPFCGGVSAPATLDHFLPKSRYPHCAVMPVNLLPACYDCNLGAKLTDDGGTYGLPFIHPYLDKDRYFKEQWIFADYFPGGEGKPGWFEYYAQPPSYWSDRDRDRARRHFNEFRIGYRFSLKAAEQQRFVIGQIWDWLDEGYSSEEVAERVTDRGSQRAPFANYWAVGMFQALGDWLRR